MKSAPEVLHAERAARSRAHPSRGAALQGRCSNSSRLVGQRRAICPDDISHSRSRLTRSRPCSARSRSAKRSPAILDAGGQPQQVRRAGRPGALDRGAVLDQALDAAERGRPLPQFDARRRRHRRRLAAAHADAEHAAEAVAHLPPCNVVAGMAGQPRIEHLGDRRVPDQALGELHRRSARRLDAQAEESACRGSGGKPRAAQGSARASSGCAGSRSHSASARAVASAPATTSEWPFKYLVAACMTMSAPCSSGRVSIGVARSSRPRAPRRPHARSPPPRRYR